MKQAFPPGKKGTLSFETDKDVLLSQWLTGKKEKVLQIQDFFDVIANLEFEGLEPENKAFATLELSDPVLNITNSGFSGSMVSRYDI